MFSLETEKTCWFNARTKIPKASTATPMMVKSISFKLTPPKSNCFVKRYDPKAENTSGELDTLGHAFHNTANSTINPTKQKVKPKV